MDKKALIVVSLCAVVLLILGSLSNVVGYNSVKSTMNDSPLFQTRTKKATNQQQNIITSQYLGKNKDSIPSPFLNNRTLMIQKCIEQIRNMDDNTFSRFVKYAISLLTQQGTVKYCDTKDIEDGVYLLRKNAKVYDDTISLNMKNITWGSTPTLCWSPGCFLIILYNLFLVFVLTFAFNCFPSMKMCITLFHCYQ